LLIVVILAVVAVVMLSGNNENNGGTTAGNGGTQVVVQRTHHQPHRSPHATPTEQLPEISSRQSIPVAYHPARGGGLRNGARCLPFNAVLDLEDVIGMHARTDLYIEQPILTSMVSLIWPIWPMWVPILPRSSRKACCVRSDGPSHQRGLCHPAGDHVDIIVSMLYVEIDKRLPERMPTKSTWST